MQVRNVYDHDGFPVFPKIRCALHLTKVKYIEYTLHNLNVPNKQN